MRAVVDVEAVVEFGEINDALWRALEQMAPFGMGNPRPLFRSCAAHNSPGLRRSGRKKHIKLAARQGGRR